MRLHSVLARLSAVLGTLGFIAILASNLWCEPACVAAQAGLVAEATACHETQEASAAVAINGHHDCRDHQLESLTATATPRVNVHHLIAALSAFAFIEPSPDAAAIQGATRIDRSPPPLVRTITVLRI